MRSGEIVNFFKDFYFSSGRKYVGFEYVLRVILLDLFQWIIGVVQNAILRYPQKGVKAISEPSGMLIWQNKGNNIPKKVTTKNKKL